MREKLIGGRYQVCERIGLGGMGVVHVAKDLERTRRVAIKFRHADPDPTDYEVELGRACHHPNVVSVLDSGRHEDRAYIVMEYVDAHPLETKPAVKLPVARAVAIVRQILDGLGAIHRAGYVHGDIKSGNVLVTTNADGKDVVKIIDLGLARPLAGVVRDSDGPVITGTPDYLAPEVIAGGPKSVASDLYAIGVLLYELLTGTRPFEGGTAVEILHRHIENDVPSPTVLEPDLPPALALAVTCALAKLPQHRHRNAPAFAYALATAVDEPSDGAPTRSWPRPLGRGTQPMDVPFRLIVDALESAKAHVDAHRMQAAASELEAALGMADEDSDETWRLMLPLAAIYDSLGDPRRGRDLTEQALALATSTGSDLGQQRAKLLLQRFAGRA